MQKNSSKKNETMNKNQSESYEFHVKNEDMDSPYNIQENKNPYQRSQQSSKQENPSKKVKAPKDRQRIKTPDFLKLIQKNTNFPAIYVLISIVSCGLFVLFGSFEIFFTNLIGLVLPIYWTMRAFNDLNKKDEDKQWYTYWLIYLAMVPIDMFFGRFLKHIPLFYFAKYVFLCWMFLPNFKGASYIHDILIKKRFPDFDIVHRIDKSSEKIKHQFKNLTGRIHSRFFGNKPHEADQTNRIRIKKHEKPSMDKPADLHNSIEESRNIDEDINKMNLEHEGKEETNKNEKENKNEQKQVLESKKIEEQIEKPKETSLKEIFDEKDKEGKASEEEHHEQLQTNESESDKGKEGRKDSDAYKNAVSKISNQMKSGVENTKEKINSSIENLWEKMGEGDQAEKNKEQSERTKSEDKKEEKDQKQSDLGVPVNRDTGIEDEQTRKISEKNGEDIQKEKPESDKIITEKPFKDSKHKEIEPEKPFKAGKKMPEVDIEKANDENKENVRTENISQKTQKKEDVNAAHVFEKEKEKNKEAGVSNVQKETKMKH